MSNIDEYDSEFRGHVQAAEEKIAAAARSGGDEQRAAAAAAERAADAAKDVVQLMELEGRSLSGAARTKLQAKLRASRDEVGALKARIKELKAVARSTPQREDRIREDLFAGGYRSGDDAGEHSRMLAANERLGQGTDRLRDAHQVTLDMENTANSILGDLSRQRETIMHAKGTLRYASEGLESSKRVLSQMARRAAMNKYTMWIVIGLLIVMVLLLLATGRM